MDMNTYAGHGHKILYVHYNTGPVNDQTRALRWLTVGNVYTVDECYTTDKNTISVFLMEVPGIGFNSLLFDDAE